VYREEEMGMLKIQRSDPRERGVGVYIRVI
jgi:hypothetical protein